MGHVANRVISASPPLSPLLWSVWLMVLITAAAMPARFKRMKNKQDSPFTLFLKGLPMITVIFLVCVNGGFPQAAPHARWMLAGLIFCLGGDIVLGIHFIAGGGLFLTGHICYVIGLLGQQTLAPVHGILFVLVLGLLVVFLSLFRSRMPDKRLFPAVCVYAAALAGLMAAALPLPFTARSPQAYLAALGAVLFVVSDMTLCDNMLNTRPLRNEYISLGIYYTAQFLLGASLFTVL
ncbi:MAG: lysoplasmalogenase [Clostridiales bacterium]|nr:lysoplasmalogenase [Clostridiales bacterium]